MARLALVTGGTGFLGRHLVRALAERGWRVRLLVRSGAAGRVETPSGVEIVCGDLLDLACVRAAVAGATAAFHLAGRLQQAGVPASEYERVHVGGTVTLLRACHQAGGLNAIVLCSTTGVLGPTGPEPATEEAPLRPGTWYERSKARGETVATLLAMRHGLPLTIARPSLVYGPGDRHLLAWFRRIAQGACALVGPGDNLVHPVFVGDLIEGLRRCGEARPDRVRVYHLVGPEALPIRGFAGAIARAVGRRRPPRHLPMPVASGIATLLERLPIPPGRLPLTRSRIAFMTETRVYSGARARAELAFAAPTGVRAGVRQAIAWYRREGLL